MKGLTSHTWHWPPSLLMPAVDAQENGSAQGFSLLRVFIFTVVWLATQIFQDCCCSVLLCSEAENLSTGAAIPASKMLQFHADIYVQMSNLF